jgi:hypothetical protein
MSLVFASLVLWSKASEAAETEKIPLSFSFKFMGARLQVRDLHTWDFEINNNY